MKAIATILAVLVLFPAVSFAAQHDATNVSRVYRVSGDVFVMQGKHPAQRVTNSEPIMSDTLIQTGDKGAALLKFEDGQVVTMQAGSIFKVREYRYDAKRIENSSIVFSMYQGGMRFISGSIGQHNRQAFRLSTPNATIGIHGTDFMVTLVGKSVYSRVLAGKITLTNAAGMKTVGKGQTVVATSSAVLPSFASTLTVPAGTFDKLQFIPVDPSTIPAPEAAPIPAAPTVAATVTLPETPEPASAVAPAANLPATSVVATGTAMTAGGNSGTSVAETTSPAATTASPEASPEPAKTAEANPMDENSRSDLAVVGKISSLGLGAELYFGLNDSLGARIGLNSFNYKYNANSSTVNYDFNLQLQTVSALADWYPFQGSFRTSAGLMYNNNKDNLTGIPAAGGGFIINGNNYPSVSSLQGTMTFNKVAPYIGIGWGNPAAKNKGWGMTSDIGVLYQGSPKINLTFTCTASCPTMLQADATAENAKLQNDLSNFKWWPVVSVGISYQW